MDGTLFLLYWFAVIGAVLLLVRIAGIRLLAVSIPSLLLGSYLAYAWLGLPVLFFHLDPHRLDVEDQETIWLVASYAGLAFVLLAVGMLLASRTLGPIRLPDPKARDISNQILPMNAVSLGAIILLSGLCLFVTYLYIKALPAIPLMAAISGDINLAKVLRSTATNDFDGKLWRYQLFTHTISPFLVYVCLAQAVVRRYIVYWLLFLVIFGTTVFILLIDTQKGPAVNLLIGLVCVVFLARARPISPVFLTSAVSILILAAMLQYQVMFLGDRFEPMDLLGGVASRIFCGQIHPAYFYVEYFPDYMPFLEGASFPNPMGILPFEHVKLSYMVMDYMVGPGGDVEVVGSAPTAFWGEAFANFGIYGVAIVALLAGYLIYATQFVCDRMQRSALRAATIGWMGMHLSRLAVTGFSGYLFDVKLVAVVCMATVLNDLNRFGSAPRQKATQPLPPRAADGFRPSTGSVELPPPADRSAPAQRPAA